MTLQCDENLLWIIVTVLNSWMLLCPISKSFNGSLLLGNTMEKGQACFHNLMFFIGWEKLLIRIKGVLFLAVSWGWGGLFVCFSTTLFHVEKPLLWFFSHLCSTFFKLSKSFQNLSHHWLFFCIDFNICCSTAFCIRSVIRHYLTFVS